MKLRNQILCCISVTLVVLIPSISSFYSRVLMRSYTQLELQDTQQNTERALRAFTELDDTLHDKSIDWANWDDTYQFMADHNKTYIKSNLVADSVISMKLDMILYIDNQAKIFHTFTTKRFPDIPSPDTAKLWHDLKLDNKYSTVFQNRSSFSGVILHPNCPLLVSVRPIQTSKGTGPQRGWLVFVRYFDARQLRALEEQTQLAVQIHAFDSPLISNKEKQIIKELSSIVPIKVAYQNDRSVMSYTRLMDVQNKPILLLKVTLPRRIYAQGLASSHNLNRLILFAALVFIGVILLVIEFSVLTRLSKLNTQVEQIGKDGDHALRVRLSGRDELTSLAGQINGMLMKLEGTTKTLYESKEMLRCQNENLESIVTERTQELLHQTFHDTLTGLPNRAQVLFRLKQISDTRTSGGKAVLFLNLDNFKFINDSLGHSAGDELLIAFGDRLRKCVSPTDLVARSGGDEFIILLESIHEVESAIRTAGKVLEIINTGFTLRTGQVNISTCIGIAYTEALEIDPDVLLRDADTAMYQIKTHGKADYTVFETGMNDRMAERVEIEVSLRMALENEELVVHYQPLVDLSTGHLTGVEALVRWHHPEKGMIAPGRFIYVAEETGMIIPIGYWVLEEACRQTLAWKMAYPNHGDFITNVNLSGIQLEKPDVVERVREILERTELPAGSLKMEITESVMIADTEVAIEKLSQLRALGVRLALDDFGTGYSSMASLSSFPLDTVKIDQSFIKRLGTHPEVHSVVAAIIMLAKSLNMNVTGEGIETAEQVAILQGLGCDIGQGYFFGRALNVAGLEEQLDNGTNSPVNNVSESDTEFIERLLSQYDESILASIRKAA